MGDKEFRDVEEVLDTVEEAAHQIQIALTTQPEPIDVYLFLQERFSDRTDLRKHSVFKFVFRSYYRLDNAGLTEDFKQKFFELFEENRHLPDPHIPQIIRRLSEVQTLQHSHTLQFSFATKMAATINPRLPIYDSFVAGLFSFSPGYHIRDMERRIDRFMQFYAHLQRTIEEARSRASITTLSKAIGEEVAGWKGIEWAKQADFILWTAGKALKKRDPKRVIAR